MLTSTWPFLNENMVSLFLTKCFCYVCIMCSITLSFQTVLSERFINNAVAQSLFIKKPTLSFYFDFILYHRAMKRNVFRWALITLKIYSIRHILLYMCLTLIPFIPLLTDLYACFKRLSMMILIESKSMLIVYWLGDRKLINAYLTKKQHTKY